MAKEAKTKSAEASQNDLKGMNALSDVYKQYSNSFYKELEKLGYYTRKDR